MATNDTCSGVPFWAPDGQSFYCYRFDEQQIVQVDVDSKSVLRTLHSDGQGAAISPDGRYIAHGDATGLVLKVLSLANGESRELVRLSPPARIGNMDAIDWTPDGRAVVYSRLNGDEGMWMVPIDGGAPHKITVNVGRPIIGWQIYTKTGQVAFTTNSTFGRLEVWKMENFLP